MDWLIEGTIAGTIARLTGSMKFRFILQPIVSILLGVRDGRKDAAAGKAPYIYDIFLRPEHRDRALRVSVKSLATPILIGTALDCVAQYLLFDRVWLIPALIVGFTVMAFPYSFARGITNRVVRKKETPK